MVKSGFDLGALTRDYGDVQAEAASCRSGAALFDFSFMSRVRIKGPGACALIAKLTPRRFDDLPAGRIRYALQINTAGHVVRDLTIWRLGEDCFEVFSGSDDEIAQLKAAEGPTVSVRDLSGETAILAVQGPESLRALCAAGVVEPPRALPYFAHMRASIAGLPCRIGRLGYTGERGFEIVLPRGAREAIWNVLAEHARPAGFAAADVLRIEAGFILFANELRFAVSPAELGLGRFASEPAWQTTAQPRARTVRLVCFQATCDSVPVLWEPHCNVGFPPAPGVIVVTSACRSILTGGVMGLGYALATTSGTKLCDPAGQFRDIREVSLPFFDPAKQVPRGAWRADMFPESVKVHSFQ
jgi:glycine cleavage system aminomethyltransferase T